MKCQCGRDTLFMDDLGCGPLVCRRCGALLCPLCGDEPCQRCEERAKLRVSVGDTVIQEYEGRPLSRTVLQVTMIEGGMIFAAVPARVMAVRAQVWGLDGGKAKDANSWSQGGGRLRVPEPGELDAMEREREERAKLAHEVTKLVDQFEHEPDHGESYTNAEGLAKLAVKWRTALREIRDHDSGCPVTNMQRIAKEALGE